MLGLIHDKEAIVIKININLNKNFVTQYNKLQAEYGTDIAALNGFGDEQLSYTDFINNFIDEDTVADSSIDGNSNVSHKDIVTLEREMPKPHSKLLAFNKIYYEIQKKYGFKAANEWLEMEWVGKLYLHDANSATYRHYCYKGDELIIIKKDNKTYNTTLKRLVEFLTEEEKTFDAKLNQEVYYPNNLFIQDKNGWTKIIHYVAHNNDKSMRFIKTANGKSFIVTEDHPCITKRGDVPAKELTLEDIMFTYQPDYFDNTISSIDVSLTPGQKRNKFTKGQGTITLNKDLGWLTGIILSEGTVENSEIKL